MTQGKNTSFGSTWQGQWIIFTDDSGMINAEMNSEWRIISTNKDMDQKRKTKLTCGDCTLSHTQSGAQPAQKVG